MNDNTEKFPLIPSTHILTPSQALDRANKLLADPNAGQGFKGKKNLYLCSKCGRGHITVDIDVGVTPFMMHCLSCGGASQSTFYRLDPLLRGYPAAVEWYRPAIDDPKLIDQVTLEHVSRGGLLWRLAEVKS